jgi:hypothetical protein
MVFWIVCKDAGAAGERRFGPYESEAAALHALVGLKKRYRQTTAPCFQVVLDYV